MKAIILDTEYTSWKGCNEHGWNESWQHKEIVQIAAIMVDIRELKELNYCSILIKPTVNPDLSDYFANLTGISNQTIVNGKSFREGIEEYSHFVGSKPVYACGDEGKIIDINLELNGIKDLSRLNKTSNLRPWFCENGLNAEIIPSGELHKSLGISLQGTTHNALHDVRSILASIKYLMKDGIAHPFTR